MSIGIIVTSKLLKQVVSNRTFVYKIHVPQCTAFRFLHCDQVKMYRAALFYWRHRSVLFESRMLQSDFSMFCPHSFEEMTTKLQ